MSLTVQSFPVFSSTVQNSLLRVTPAWETMPKPQTPNPLAGSVEHPPAPVVSEHTCSELGGFKHLGESPTVSPNRKSPTWRRRKNHRCR